MVICYITSNKPLDDYMTIKSFHLFVKSFTFLCRKTEMLLVITLAMSHAMF